MKNLKMIAVATAISSSMLMSTAANADLCADVSFAQFKQAADYSYKQTNKFGFGLPMWATLMNHVGDVCYVYSVRGGATPVANGGSISGRHAWLGSRVISAQKANTANQFSLNDLAISTGALSVAVYPGGSLYGLQHSNPVDATVAYSGYSGSYGTVNDPLVGKRVGGVNVFGGGVAAYDSNGNKQGAIGVSGDTSCRDHTMAYRLRVVLGLDNQPNDDGLAFVASPAALFEQPSCGVNDPAATAAHEPGTATASDDFGSR